MNKISLITKLELERYNWNKIETANGNASNIPQILEELFSSENPDKTEELYWKIENSVFVQGTLFPAAEYLIPVLMTSLLNTYSTHIKSSILEFLFQMLAYDNSDLGIKCRKKAKENIGILYHELVYGEQQAAMEILELIETDKERLNYYIEKLKIPPIILE